MRRLGFSAIFLVFSVVLPAQDTEIGRQIYSNCAKSVFILYARDSSGEFVAQGSGFWASGQKLITNAHVANAGKIYVDVGSARVPAKIQSIDAYNDLAVLTVEIEITANPLVLSGAMPAPGEAAFAIGNPRGLERTISEGVVSATREVEGRELLQITAPISHGSSGGPILNTKGQVIGVAVGFLESGQSLNFAVPASKIINLLRTGTPKLDLSLFDQIDSLQTQQQSDTYSSDPDSSWQKRDKEIKSLLQKAYEAAGNNDTVLLRVARLANTNGETDVAVSAAERLVTIRPSLDIAHLLYAQALTQKYTWTRDEAEKQRIMPLAEREARAAVSIARVPSAEDYSVLANVLEDRGSYKDAKANFRLALDTATKADDSENRLSSIHGLIRCADALREFDEADRLLAQLRRDGKSTTWDWSFHADNLLKNDLYQRAGDSYRAAGELDGPYTNWCTAATMYSVTPQQEDSVLFCARKCIEKGTGQKDSEADLGEAHRQIADVLNSRGVYLEALNHAKEVTVLKPDNAFGYDDMAVALEGLRRFGEAVTAEEQAVRLSDGKFGWMHFHLGSAYFSLENWQFALQSFEKAAELAPDEPASAYNVALCHQRLGHFVDAIHWYQEYLKRKPNADDKVEILELIQRLRQ